MSENLSGRSMKTKAALASSKDEIVISGISGRFPNSKNVAEFARNLYNKVNMVDDKETRWKHLYSEVPKRFGKVDGLEKFDANFFSVHHRQVNSMDPQCRMLLEHSYEAILDAGINPKTLRGSRTGVFIGCSTCETDQTLFYNKTMRDGLALVG
jgi:fatty acid synthase, animal type